MRTLAGTFSFIIDKSKTVHANGANTVNGETSTEIEVLEG